MADCSMDGLTKKFWTFPVSRFLANIQINDKTECKYPEITTITEHSLPMTSKQGVNKDGRDKCINQRKAKQNSPLCPQRGDRNTKE